MSDLQQRGGEPAAAGLSVRHEERRHSGEMGQNVPEVQRHDAGSGEGQAAVRTGISGERGPSLSVSKTFVFVHLITNSSNKVESR